MVALSFGNRHEGTIISKKDSYWKSNPKLGLARARVITREVNGQSRERVAREK